MSSIRVMLNYLHCLNIPSLLVTGITCGHYQFGWMDEFTNKFAKIACTFILFCCCLLHYTYIPD